MSTNLSLTLVSLLTLGASASPAFAAEGDLCSVSVHGNTNKVERKLKEILVAKKYRIVDDFAQSRYHVQAGREDCNFPLGCGFARYLITVYTPSRLDPRPGMKDLTATYRELHREDAFEALEAEMPDCPDAP